MADKDARAQIVNGDDRQREVAHALLTAWHRRGRPERLTVVAIVEELPTMTTAEVIAVLKDLGLTVYTEGQS